MMLIGELAAMTGLSAHGIRFYEKQGLLDGTRARRGENNYRYYAPEAVERLLLIRQGQAAGFTLAEMRDLIVLWEQGELSDETVQTLVAKKLIAIERKIADLEQMKTYLRAKLAAYTAKENG